MVRVRWEGWKLEREIVGMRRDGTRRWDEKRLEERSEEEERSEKGEGLGGGEVGGGVGRRVGWRRRGLE